MSTPRRFRANVPTPAQDEAKPKLKRKKCLNCDKKFELTKPNRKFCTTECKNEFGRHGSAFGPLKTHIETMMTRHTRALRAEVVKLQRELLLAIDRVVAIENFLEECGEPDVQPADSVYATPTAKKFRRGA
jgi:hypothetical protein